MLKATSGYIGKGQMQSRVWRPVAGMRGSVTERLVEKIIISHRKNVSNTREGTGDTMRHDGHDVQFEFSGSVVFVWGSSGSEAPTTSSQRDIMVFTPGAFVRILGMVIGQM